MGTYVTRYETNGGKTRRAKDTPPAAEAAEPAAAPKANPGADNNQTPGKPAKQGA